MVEFNKNKFRNTVATYKMNLNIVYGYVNQNKFEQNLHGKKIYLSWKTLISYLLKNASHILYFQLTVTAEDLSYPFRSSTSNVIVNIIRNANTPIFNSGANYDVTISEEKPVIETILTVSATDQDEGRNGDVRYSIFNAAAQTIFAINSVTGEIYSRVSLLETSDDVYSVSLNFSNFVH